MSTGSWQENGELEVNNTVFHDIDSSIQVLNINQAFSKPTPPPLRLTREQWSRLTNEARHTWDQLSNDMKAIILGTQRSSTGPPPPQPRR